MGGNRGMQRVARSRGAAPSPVAAERRRLPRRCGRSYSTSGSGWPKQSQSGTGCRSILPSARRWRARSPVSLMKMRDSRNVRSGFHCRRRCSKSRCLLRVDSGPPATSRKVTQCGKHSRWRGGRIGEVRDEGNWETTADWAWGSLRHCLSSGISPTVADYPNQPHESPHLPIPTAGSRRGQVPARCRCYQVQPLPCGGR